jgi:hypothetical protein
MLDSARVFFDTPVLLEDNSISLVSVVVKISWCENLGFTSKLGWVTR